MTREEAIKRVQAMLTYMETLDADEEEQKDIEAYRMAIAALKAEPCEDAVSKAIKTISNYCSERTCVYCRLFSSEGCIFSCSYPHEWSEIQEELKGESE